MITLSKESQSIIHLGNLNIPRCNAKLVVHDGYVYIFGGYHDEYLKSAERMKIGNSVWMQLPNMVEGRYDFGVHIAKDKIYLIGGYHNTTIEYYDVGLNCFYLLPNVQVPCYGIVSGMIGEQVYVIGRQHLRIFSEDMQLVDYRNNINNNVLYCFSDIVVRESCFYFISSANDGVFCFDARFRTLKLIKSL
jgi:hypothetical protein